MTKTDDDEPDAAQFWRAHKAEVRRHRQQALAKADVTGWTKVTPYHFRRFFGPVRVEWYPSGGKALIGADWVRGHRNVTAAIEALKAEHGE